MCPSIEVKKVIWGWEEGLHLLSCAGEVRSSTGRRLCKSTMWFPAHLSVLVWISLSLLYPKQPEPALETPLLWITGTSGTTETARGKCVHWYPEARTPARAQTKPRARILWEILMFMSHSGENCHGVFWGAGFLNTTCKCDLAKCWLLLPISELSTAPSMQCGDLSDPRTRNMHQNPAGKPQTPFHSDHCCWAAGLLTDQHWTQTGFCGHRVTDQPEWPESTTPALSSDLEEEALPHFIVIAICNDKSYRFNPNALKNFDLFWSSSHCRPVSTQIIYCFTNYHWLVKCTSAALSYLLESTTKIPRAPYFWICTKLTSKYKSLVICTLQGIYSPPTEEMYILKSLTKHEKLMYKVLSNSETFLCCKQWVAMSTTGLF